MERRRVLVTGATGRQGGAAARQLIERGHHVRVLSRFPDGKAAERLAHLGASVAWGDFNDPESLRRAATGMDAAVLVTTPKEAGAAAEARQGRAAVEAFCDAGVGLVVYSSVAGALDETGVPHFESKASIERALAAAPCDSVVVAPVFFRENLLAPLWRDGIQQGTLAMALAQDTPLQNVEVEEIARMVCQIIEDAPRYSGRRIELASDATTPRQMARILGKATGQQVGFVQIPLEVLEEQDPGFSAMFRWLGQGGYRVDLRALRRSEPEVEWRSFSAWAQAQPWRRLLDARP